MAETRRGRVRPGVSGYHPGLAQNLIAGLEYDVPVEQWSDGLFEDVTASTPDTPSRKSRWPGASVPQADKEE